MALNYIRRQKQVAAANVDTPPAGYIHVFIDTDGVEKKKDENGVVTVTDQTLVDTYILASEKGAANGVATLDAGAKVPASQLPSYVDDVEEYANLGAFPGAGETGKIYVALDTGKTYRWTGSVYVEISASEVNSVNGNTGVVVLDADDIDDSSTSHKFVTASDLTNLGNLSGTNSGDVTLNAGGDTQDSANLAGQELELVPATATTSGIVSKIAQVWAGIKTFLAERIVIDSPSTGDNLEIGYFDDGTIAGYGIRTTGVGGLFRIMTNATNPQIVLGIENNTTGSAFIDVDNNRPLNLNVLDTGAGTPAQVNVGSGGFTVGGNMLESFNFLATTSTDNITLAKTNSSTSWAVNAGRAAFFDNWLLFKNSAEATNYTLGLTNTGSLRAKNGSAGSPAYGFGNGSNYGMSLNAGNNGTQISAAGLPLLTVFGTATKRTEIRQDSMFRLPRMTTATRDGLSPLDGDMILNTTTNKVQARVSGAWVDLH